ncbi:MAG: hypothetical protein Q8P18_25070 [Pseudomonadota bacterium]|nr:hypothetical protein [Pseudomonadota bacterium]
MADEDDQSLEGDFEENTKDIPPSASISKERADGQDSRATARVGEEPDGPSTRVTEGRGIAARIAEHEAIIQHKELPERGRRHKKR